jgi:hypothetical protein
MFGVKIEDLTTSEGGGSFLSFDLRDILAVVGEPALTSRWRCRGLRYLEGGEGSVGEFHEERREFTGDGMQRFAATVLQTIDGRFEARSAGAAKRLWLIILAGDSSWFEVWSSKPAVLESVRGRFKNVSDLPAGAA